MELRANNLSSDANLKFYTRLEGNANDELGLNNCGSTDITYSVANGKFGQGGSFNGDTSIATKTSPTSDILNIFDGGGSFCAWIYASSTGEGVGGRIVDKTGSTAAGFSLFTVDDDASGHCKLQFFRSFSTTNGNWKTTDAIITYDTWYFICVTYDSSSSSNDPLIYLNATSQSVTETVTPVGSSVTDDGLALCIGNRSDTARGYYGKLDDIYLFDRTINSTEISSLYAIKAWTNTLNDTVTLSETIVKGISHKLSDIATMTEVFFDTIKARGLEFVETVTMSEVFQRARTRILSDVGTLTEVLSFLRGYFVTLTDSFSGLTDTLTTLRVRLASLLDTTTLSETIKKASTRVLSETATLSEVIVKNYGRVLALLDTATLSETIKKASTRLLSETATISDTIRKYINGLLISVWTKVVKLTASFTKTAKPTGTWTKTGKPY